MARSLSRRCHPFRPVQRPLCLAEVPLGGTPLAKSVSEYFVFTRLLFALWSLSYAFSDFRNRSLSVPGSGTLCCLNQRTSHHLHNHCFSYHVRFKANSFAHYWTQEHPTHLLVTSWFLNFNSLDIHLLNSITVNVANGTTLNVTSFVRVSIKLGTLALRLFLRIIATPIPVVLGYPFLHQFEPTVNWRKRVVTIKRKDKVYTIPALPAHESFLTRVPQQQRPTSCRLFRADVVAVF